MILKDLLEVTSNDIIVVEKISDDKVVIAENIQSYLSCVVVEIEAIDFKQLIVYI